MDVETRADRADHTAHPPVAADARRPTGWSKARTRRLLQERYATTLPRFDLMAQLERAPKGLKMGELSRRMMVTGGNVTGITDMLETEGLVERGRGPGRTGARTRVRLTRRGAARASPPWPAEHERWIVESFKELTGREMATMAALLARLKTHVRSLEERDA